MKPTQQEIIDVARAVDIVPGIGDVVNGKYRPHKNALGKSVPVEWLQEFAKLLLGRFGAGGGEPVAWIYWHPSDDTFDGPDTIHKKAVSRFTDDTRLTMQRKGWRFEPLYTHPSPTDLRAEYLRGAGGCGEGCRCKGADMASETSPITWLFG